MVGIRSVFLAALCVLSLAPAAGAQTAVPADPDEGWRVAVYPILAWVPIAIETHVDIPPVGGDGGGSGEILDGRFDGAFFGGVSATNGAWRIEGYALWAAFGGDRLERPSLVVDVDLIYGSGKLGRRIAPDFYVTGGVRRVAIDYEITLGTLPRLSRKPGVWDPIVGVGWHRVGRKVEWHASFDGGGFGVGSDVDLGAAVSVDWKPITHFGFTAGYNLLYLKFKDTVMEREITVQPTLHGPTVGIGFYF